MKIYFACFILFTAGSVIAADRDTTKISEGTVWSGTYRIKSKKKVIYSSGLEIKITKLEKGDFVGMWSQSANDVAFEIKGHISGSKLSFKFTDALKGKPYPGVVGGRIGSGVLRTKEGKDVLMGTTVSDGDPDEVGEWQAELKTQ